MRKWLFPLLIGLIFIVVGSLFFIPSISGHCTDPLLTCIEQGAHMSLGAKLWHTLVCVYYNVICVLGGLFV